MDRHDAIERRQERFDFFTYSEMMYRFNFMVASLGVGALCAEWGGERIADGGGGCG